MRSIELSVVKGCPVRCSYCPQERLRNATPSGVGGLMSQSVARVVMNNARADLVVFAGFVEPTAHPQWVDLVNDALDRSRRVKLHTTTFKLTAAHVEGLAACRRVDKQVHVTRRTLSNVLELTPLIRELWPAAEWVAFDRSLEDEEGLAELFAGPLQKLWPHSRAANVTTLDATRDGPVGRPVACPKVQNERMPVVLPDGSAYACCQDYGLELPIGNLAEQDWDELDFDALSRRMLDPSNDLPCHRGCSEAVERVGGGLPVLD